MVGVGDPQARDARHKIISDAIWNDAIAAFEENIPQAAIERMSEEDLHAAVQSLIERIDDAGLTVLNRERMANYLLTYSGSGDTSDPWQAGHNYAMREAARMVREGWTELPNAIDDGDPR